MAEHEGDEEEFVILDEPPEEHEEHVPGPDEHEDEEHEDEDERLGTDHDDETGDGASKSAARRKERKERQRRAREATEQELQYLRAQVGHLSQRVQAQEGYNAQTYEQQLVAQYHAAAQEAQQAEQIMARAMEAQNGEDHTQALRIRDNAIMRANGIRQQYDQLQAAKQQPQVDPSATVVEQHRNEWMSANTWFDGSGTDPDSAAVRAIDLKMQQEGLNPATRGYWQELTRRANTHFNAKDNGNVDTQTGKPLRNAPPQGGRREHAPTSTRREIYVTPERKQAMIDAGVWDDPQKRNQMLKAYAEYDRQHAGS